MFTIETLLAASAPTPDFVRGDRLRYWRTGFPCRFPCDWCGATGYPFFMVTDEVWLSVAPRKARWMSCLRCFEARLGRPVRLAEVRPCPLSDWLVIRLMNGGHR